MAKARGRCVLAVDVGNTVTRFGLFDAASGSDELELLGSCELTTLAPVTADEARVRLGQALALLPDVEPAGAILSCVVPSVTDAWRRACAAAVPSRALVVGPGLRTGLRMRYDDPGEVGPDRVADVVAARHRYGAPVVVVDLGTTTNLEVIDADGAFAGGVIAPGMALGAHALAEAAARLPEVELRAPAGVIGRNTRAAMQSGVVLGEAARIDGLLDGVAAELGCAPTVVLTGDDAAGVACLIAHDAEVDDTLTLRGLALLWAANAR